MKVVFNKKVKDAESKDAYFEVGKSYEISDERAKIAISKGYAKEVVEVADVENRSKPKSKKLQKKTIKK